MEDGLRGNIIYITICTYGVLILVVMEDGLRDALVKWVLYKGSPVLILVVMEDGLRGI